MTRCALACSALPLLLSPAHQPNPFLAPPCTWRYSALTRPALLQILDYYLDWVLARYKGQGLLHHHHHHDGTGGHGACEALLEPHQHPRVQQQQQQVRPHSKQGPGLPLGLRCASQLLAPRQCGSGLHAARWSAGRPTLATELRACVRARVRRG